MKKTLVVGASPNSDRYAFKATEMLNEYNHKVYAFGLKMGKINNTEIQTIWPESNDFDTVTLYVGPQNQGDYMDKIIALKPKRVIFNPGTENKEFEELLTKNNIEPIEACTLVMLRTNQF
ncbi:MAG: CoA-binding protein [Bacteroidia bacterium]